MLLFGKNLSTRMRGKTKMIKNFAPMFIFFLVMNLQATADTSIPEQFIGTYVARDYITSLRITRSHITSMALKSKIYILVFTR